MLGFKSVFLPSCILFFFLFLRVFFLLSQWVIWTFCRIPFWLATVLLSVCLYIVKEEYSVTLVRGDKAGFVQDHRCGYRHHCSGILQFVGRVAPSEYSLEWGFIWSRWWRGWKITEETSGWGALWVNQPARALWTGHRVRCHEEPDQTSGRSDRVRGLVKLT